MSVQHGHRACVQQNGAFRAVFVTAQLPEDFDKAVYGIYLRMQMLIAAAVRLGPVKLLFLVPEGTDCSPTAESAFAEAIALRWGLHLEVKLWPVDAPPNVKSAWRQLFAPILGAKYRQEYLGLTSRQSRAGLVAFIRDCGADYLFAHRLSAAVFLSDADADLPPVIFDLDDIEHRKSLRELRQQPFRKGMPFLYMQIPALMHAEFVAIRSFSKTLVCSELDASYLTQRWGMPRIEVIPNALSFPESPPEDSDGKTLLFVGSYSYEPNIQAAEYLVTLVWPRISGRLPNARLMLVGKRADRIPAASNPPPGVEFAGFVPDLAEVYANAAVVCCPILVGGGTRIKIIEAAGYGRAIVSTTVGAEGLDLQDGESVLLRNEPTAFADACIDLLQDRARRQALGAAARAAVIGRYDRARVVERICNVIEDAVADARGN